MSAYNMKLVIKQNYYFHVNSNYNVSKRNYTISSLLVKYLLLFGVS